ncbi:MAG: hypothetical protein E6R03_02095 [Hyphomicrobiaceae bacterium]|nr:MAG: hypothetical protein E6R03_02095 [Hyphomicrobiaceae bacterium]
MAGEQLRRITGIVPRRNQAVEAEPLESEPVEPVTPNPFAAGKFDPSVLAQTAPVRTDGGSPFEPGPGPGVVPGISVHLQPEMGKLCIESAEDVRTLVKKAGGRVSVEIIF